MTNPLVSVIMSVHNGSEDEISSAIESILSQTYPSIELIVCDDGSKPEIHSFLMNYSRDAKFTLLYNPACIGLPLSLNRCIKIAHGEFIARMDADDVSLPDRLSREVAFLESHPNLSFISCLSEVINEKGDKIGTISHPAFPTAREVYSKVQFVHPASTFKKEVLLSCGGYTSNRILLLGRCEDYDLWCRLYGLGFLGGNINDVPLYQYRETTNGYKKRTHKSRWFYFLEMKRARNYFSKKKLPFSPLIRSFLFCIIPSSLIVSFHKHKISVSRAS